MEIHTRNIESVQDDWEEQLCDALRARLYFFWRRVSCNFPSVLFPTKIGIRVMATMVFTVIVSTLGLQLVYYLTTTKFFTSLKKFMQLTKNEI